VARIEPFVVKSERRRSIGFVRTASTRYLLLETVQSPAERGVGRKQCDKKAHSTKRVEDETMNWPTDIDAGHEPHRSKCDDLEKGNYNEIALLILVASSIW